MIKNITGILLAFFILIQAFFIHSNVSNIVLCFGNDGHVAIEAIVPAKTATISQTHNCIHLIEFLSEENHNIGQPSDCQDIQLKTQLSDIILKQVVKLNTTHIYNNFVTIHITKLFQTFFNVLLNKSYITGISILGKIKTVILQL
ncbi:MAG: hypothetical protein GXO79_16105 [Chlorobi bacterium]|nr:hypothetical protein [Chlorobiota bacterium]